MEVFVSNRRLLVEFIALFIELMAVLIEFITPFISIAFVIQIKMQVLIMNALLLIEFIDLFVEFIDLFSNNALVLLESSVIVLAISGLARTNDGKNTEALWLMSTSPLPQKHRFQSLGANAILER